MLINDLVCSKGVVLNSENGNVLYDVGKTIADLIPLLCINRPLNLNCWVHVCAADSGFQVVQKLVSSGIDKLIT